MDKFFFGCWNEPGHILRDVNGYSVGIYGRTKPPIDFPIEPSNLDGTLLFSVKVQNEGKAVLTHIRGWTIISFWDRSVDSRPSSNASFVVRGVKAFEEALEAFKTSFPKVYSRFKFQIELA